MVQTQSDGSSNLTPDGPRPSVSSTFPWCPEFLPRPSLAGVPRSVNPDLSVSWPTNSESWYEQQSELPNVHPSRSWSQSSFMQMASNLSFSRNSSILGLSMEQWANGDASQTFNADQSATKPHQQQPRPENGMLESLSDVAAQVSETTGAILNSNPSEFQPPSSPSLQSASGSKRASDDEDADPSYEPVEINSPTDGPPPPSGHRHRHNTCAYSPRSMMPLKSSPPLGSQPPAYNLGNEPSNLYVDRSRDMPVQRQQETPESMTFVSNNTNNLSGAGLESLRSKSSNYTSHPSYKTGSYLNTSPYMGVNGQTALTGPATATTPSAYGPGALAPGMSQWGYNEPRQSSLYNSVNNYTFTNNAPSNYSNAPSNYSNGPSNYPNGAGVTSDAALVPTSNSVNTGSACMSDQELAARLAQVQDTASHLYYFTASAAGNMTRAADLKTLFHMVRRSRHATESLELWQTHALEKFNLVDLFRNSTDEGLQDFFKSPSYNYNNYILSAGDTSSLPLNSYMYNPDTPKPTPPVELQRKKRTKVADLSIRCQQCGITDTPEWRRGPNGARTLCNACGLFHAKLVKKKGETRAAEIMRERLFARQRQSPDYV